MKFVSCDILNDFKPLNASMSLRGNSKRLFVPFFKYNIRKTFFTYRMLPIWKCLQNTTAYEYLQKFCKPVK